MQTILSVAEIDANNVDALSKVFAFDIQAWTSFKLCNKWIRDIKNFACFSSLCKFFQSAAKGSFVFHHRLVFLYLFVFCFQLSAHILKGSVKIFYLAFVTSGLWFRRIQEKRFRPPEHKAFELWIVRMPSAWGTGEKMLKHIAIEWTAYASEFWRQTWNSKQKLIKSRLHLMTRKKNIEWIASHRRVDCWSFWWSFFFSR